MRVLRILPVFVLAATAAFGQQMAVPGVPNFHQVDDHFYRGAQPTPEGIQSLARLGVKTVIDLREPGELVTREEGLVKAAGMRFIHVPFNGFHAPSNDQIARVLKLVKASDGPVFIHCKRGADRTGTVVACYRIAHQQWPNPKALDEAKHYGMSWTEVGMEHYILHFAATALASSAN